MTGRSVPEWSSDNPDAAIPPRVKLRIWERCGGRCALTGRKLMPGDEYDFDHITPLIMGGRHAEFNLQLVWRVAHREKTREDVGAKAKADRIAKKHRGLWPAPVRKLQGRGFAPSRQRGNT